MLETSNRDCLSGNTVRWPAHLPRTPPTHAIQGSGRRLTPRTYNERPCFNKAQPPSYKASGSNSGGGAGLGFLPPRYTCSNDRMIYGCSRAVGLGCRCSSRCQRVVMAVTNETTWRRRRRRRREQYCSRGSERVGCKDTSHCDCATAASREWRDSIEGASRPPKRFD